MTNEQIDQLWQQAMRESIEAGEQFSRYRFASLVAAHERERCAVVAWSTGMDSHMKVKDTREVGSLCAQAIRALKD